MKDLAAVLTSCCCTLTPLELRGPGLRKGVPPSRKTRSRSGDGGFLPAKIICPSCFDYKMRIDFVSFFPRKCPGRGPKATSVYNFLIRERVPPRRCRTRKFSNYKTLPYPPPPGGNGKFLESGRKDLPRISRRAPKAGKQTITGSSWYPYSYRHNPFVVDTRFRSKNPDLRGRRNASHFQREAAVSPSSMKLGSQPSRNAICRSHWTAADGPPGSASHLGQESATGLCGEVVDDIRAVKASETSISRCRATSASARYGPARKARRARGQAPPGGKTTRGCPARDSGAPSPP